MAYRGLIPDDYLDSVRWEHRYEMWSHELHEPTPPGSSVFVAVASAVVGFAPVGSVPGTRTRRTHATPTPST